MSKWGAHLPVVEKIIDAELNQHGEECVLIGTMYKNLALRNSVSSCTDLPEDLQIELHLTKFIGLTGIRRVQRQSRAIRRHVATTKQSIFIGKQPCRL